MVLSRAHVTGWKEEMGMVTCTTVCNVVLEGSERIWGLNQRFELIFLRKNIPARWVCDQTVTLVLQIIDTNMIEPCVHLVNGVEMGVAHCVQGFQSLLHTSEVQMSALNSFPGLRNMGFGPNTS